MLKQRVLTGLALGLFAIALVFFLPQSVFMLVTAVVILAAAWEWTALAGIKMQRSRLIYIAVTAFCLWLVWHFPVVPVLLVAFIFWLFALYWVFRFPAASQFWSQQWVRIVMGLLVLVPSWLAFNVIRSSVHGPAVLFFMILLVCAADIGAYFSGRMWGKHKLMPHVSPGKTWQGFWGGLLLSLVVALIFASVFQIKFASFVMLIVLVAFLNVFSVTGDLFESMLKRHCNVKDSSNILPGHGGLLDRLDSMTAVAPIFLLGLMLHLFYLT